MKCRGVVHNPALKRFFSKDRYMVLDSDGLPVHTGRDLTKTEALKIAREARAAGEGRVKLIKSNPGPMTFSTKAAADGYARLIKAEGVKSTTTKKGVIKPKWTVTPARRPNPEGAAASMYESFHGKPSTGELVIEDKVHFHEHLAELGVLCGLKVRTVGGEDYTLEFAATGQERAGNPAKLPIYSASITQAKDIPSVTHGFTALTNARKAAAKIGSQLIVQVKDSKLKHVVYMIPAPGFSAADLDAIVRRPGGGFRAHENPKGKGKKSGPIADAYKFSKGIVPGLVSGADQLLMGKNPRRRRNSVDAGPVILCSNEKGNQLYFRGGDQSLNLADLKMDDLERDCMNIGEVWGIAYTTKKEFDNFAEIEYVHVFGPEKFNIRMPKRADLWEDAQPPKDQAFGCGELPTLTYDTLNKALHVIGGSYKIDQPMLSTSPGIEG